MQRPVFILSMITVVGLLIGYITGSFITRTYTLKRIAEVPGSPIVISSIYDSAQHAILVGLHNPGFVPINFINYSIVFTPGEYTNEAGYFLAPVALNATLQPQETMILTLSLKEHTQALAMGDVVTGTIVYTYEGLPEIYQLIHTFEQTTLTGGETQASKRRQTTARSDTIQQTNN
ncbi:MAG: hypothetical protein GXO48_07345 [Chlorobi bacterium]|nr:hypothetical protein [Chlorobiota bacterium]